MVKLLVALVALASAWAFAPTCRTRSSRIAVQHKASFDNELGAQPPLGFFDPLGLVSDGDVDNFNRLRYVEIKHGRICMLGVVGYLATEAGLRLPGEIDGIPYSSIPSGFDAFYVIPGFEIAKLIALIGFLDTFVMRDITGGEFVGDFRNGFDFGWDSFDDETKLKKRAIELNQGRAAQMGLLALMVHEQMGNPLIPKF